MTTAAKNFDPISLIALKNVRPAKDNGGFIGPFK